MTHLLRGVPGDEGARQHLAEQQEEIDRKHTSKSVGVPWNPDKGESGNFSEYTGLGGIMGFDSKRNNIGPLSVFDCFREKSILIFFLQYFYASMTAPCTRPRPTTSPPFKIGVSVDFTWKQHRMCLNPSPLTFSFQRTSHSGQLSRTVAQSRHPIDIQDSSVFVPIRQPRIV